MFNKLYSCATFLLFVLRNLSTLISLFEHVKKFPGVHDSEMLRDWVRTLLSFGNLIAVTTQTKIDDVCISTAVQIVDTDAAWSPVYRMIRGGNLLEADCTEDYRVKEVALAVGAIPPGEKEAKNPIVIINAIALIIQLVQLFKK